MAAVDLSTGLFAKQDFVRLLADEVAESVRDDRPYAVLAIVPLHLPGEGVADVVRVAADCIRDVVRDGDVAGHLDGEVLAIGLYCGDRTSAAVLAQRIQGDLRLRSQHLRNTIWEPGFAVLPDDGTTAQELLSAAIEAARNRRRRLSQEVAPIHSIAAGAGEGGRPLAAQ